VQDSHSRRAGGDDRAHQSRIGRCRHSRTIREKLTTQLIEPSPDTPAQFRAHIDADLARWPPVIAAANIKINN
jgi:tripartite-type tricarboxylate transporter receptor subunit TctC